jgi:methionine synthase I (cobalamin-dependent)
MTDPHQVNSIIATAILNCESDPAENKIEVEKAKHMAKCIITALTNAGLVVVPEINPAT